MSADQTDDWSQQTPPDLADLDRIAQAQLAFVPGVLRERIDGVVIRVEDFPDEDICQEMGLESPFDLLGLYSGVSLDQKSIADVTHHVDMIFLYRRPLLEYWIEKGADLAGVVRETLIHEIGHHFGLSDRDMEELERQADAEYEAELKRG